MKTPEPGASRHWDRVYGAKAAGELSWSQDKLATSLRLLAPHAAGDRYVVDVGAGCSTLVDGLLEQGWGHVTVLDVSAQALSAGRARLGDCEHLAFVVGDVLGWEPERAIHAWHDRAVFHFLTDAQDRRRYAELAARAVAPDGHLVIGTFAEDGPQRCSDLPTARYDPVGLAAAFGGQFEVVHDEREEHVTPWGAVQPFTWVVLRRR